MSRSDFTPEQRAALDRFDVPNLPSGFADRVTAAVTSPLPRRTLRDRRGGWKLAHRAIIGTLAAGMVSAAAVASGLLGAAGIRVPVLTAMLAPEPMPAVQTKQVARKKAPVPAAAVVAPPPDLLDTEAATAALLPQLADAKARREARRAERRAFIRENPELVPVIKQAIRNEQNFVAANPDVRELRRLPLAEREAYLAQRPDLDAALRARQAERRAFREANPETTAIIRARIEQRRAARRAEQKSVREGNLEEVR